MVGTKGLLSGRDEPCSLSLCVFQYTALFVLSCSGQLWVAGGVKFKSLLICAVTSQGDSFLPWGQFQLRTAVIYRQYKELRKRSPSFWSMSVKQKL